MKIYVQVVDSNLWSTIINIPKTPKNVFGKIIHGNQ